ncbi:MAG: antitoxin VbhA family protein [Nocardioides sp.]|uniref:antitoxin VbhA family protein n=1 Tax=Nocardioides sp. TaxID=35761 RepID=UPI0039E69B27
MTIHSDIHTITPAVEQLTPAQTARLDSLVASFAMEGMPITDAAREVGARFLLDQLTFDEAVAELERVNG